MITEGSYTFVKAPLTAVTLKLTSNLLYTWAVPVVIAMLLIVGPLAATKQKKSGTKTNRGDMVN